MLGLGILFLRRWIPESPRWLMLHGRVEEAEAIVADIETRLQAPPPDTALPRLRLRPRGLSLSDVAVTLFRTYPKRTLLGVVLMATQAFFYNAIFFTYALVLGRFYGVADAAVGLYLLPFAAGNFLGPLLLGRLFDTVGRRPMIAATYALSGLLLFATAWLFVHGHLDARTQTLAWSLVFFFASAAASSAYLTVSESFPLELRALAIALFYAFGTALGGVAGPWLFGTLIGTGERGAIGGGYVLGASLMLVGAAAAWWLGIAAERRSLEDVATPLGHIGGRGDSRRRSSPRFQAWDSTFLRGRLECRSSHSNVHQGIAGVQQRNFAVSVVQPGGKVAIEIEFNEKIHGLSGDTLWLSLEENTTVEDAEALRALFERLGHRITVTNVRS